MEQRAFPSCSTLGTVIHNPAKVRTDLRPLKLQVPEMAPEGFSDTLVLDSEQSSAFSKHALESLTMSNTGKSGLEAFPRTTNFFGVYFLASKNPRNTFEWVSAAEIFANALQKEILLFFPSDSS